MRAELLTQAASAHAQIIPKRAPTSILEKFWRASAELQGCLMLPDIFLGPQFVAAPAWVD